ncbi:hypothetical protein POSPLADRAFT_1062925 [Postia placenta MAD-698-R-SB12]|uniref:Fungal-type protein kinase domain-containing protein n=1 Tax=Postia placenta MAD-698-R-SB12 TaxID=670580 RepID=A0A1X6MIL4_9APHY|nr:hypothetical protein POSPLADRAFT_1062925 [Postia placenta MAD-698-R-SB12]OSX56178.1 hypothetical protein POSPLADRAFT_1062925 [Postia placenta MAD-698-R-SB12]
MKTDKFVYFKDSWRISTGNSEIKVYQHLHEHGVGNIATPICGGDVVHTDGTLHRTLAQDHNGKAEYIHCRLVVEEIGESILDYPTSKDLVAVMFGAVVAHRQAWEKAGVLHGDINHRCEVIQRAEVYDYLEDDSLVKAQILTMYLPTPSSISSPCSFLFTSFPDKQRG